MLQLQEFVTWILDFAFLVQAFTVVEQMVISPSTFRCETALLLLGLVNFLEDALVAFCNNPVGTFE
jgi:hypothetical protein